MCYVDSHVNSIDDCKLRLNGVIFTYYPEIFFSDGTKFSYAL